MREIELPLRTSQTREGPILTVCEASAELRYDFEGDDGSIGWVRVLFARPLSARYLADREVAADDISAAYNRLVGEPLASRRGNRWTVYFNDVGLVEILTESEPVVSEA